MLPPEGAASHQQCHHSACIVSVFQLNPTDLAQTFTSPSLPQHSVPIWTPSELFRCLSVPGQGKDQKMFCHVRRVCGCVVSHRQWGWLHSWFLHEWAVCIGFIPHGVPQKQKEFTIIKIISRTYHNLIKHPTVSVLCPDSSHALNLCWQLNLLTSVTHPAPPPKVEHNWKESCCSGSVSPSG